MGLPQIWLAQSILEKCRARPPGRRRRQRLARLRKIERAWLARLQLAAGMAGAAGVTHWHLLIKIEQQLDYAWKQDASIAAWARKALLPISSSAAGKGTFKHPPMAGGEGRLE